MPTLNLILNNISLPCGPSSYSLRPNKRVHFDLARRLINELKMCNFRERPLSVVHIFSLQKGGVMRSSGLPKIGELNSFIGTA